jgi:hypothetical protein
MPKRIAIITFLIVALVFALDSYGAANTGFEGKWVPDKGQSTDAAVNAPDIKEIEIKQSGNEYVIKSKYVEPKTGLYPLLWLGIMAYELKLNGDGSDTVNLLGPFKHQSKTTVQGNTMTTDFIAANEAGEAVTGQWVRTVSGDGRTLTCQIRTKASDGRTLEKTLSFRRK